MSYPIQCFLGSVASVKINVLSGHNRACAVFRIFEYLIYLLSRFSVSRLDYPCNNICRHFLDNIYRIIKIKVVNDLLKLFIRKGIDKHHLCIAVHISENVSRNVLVQKTEQQRKFIFFDLVIVIKLLQKSSHVGFVHIHKYFTDSLVVSAFEQLQYCVKHYIPPNSSGNKHNSTNNCTYTNSVQI